MFGVAFHDYDQNSSFSLIEEIEEEVEYLLERSSVKIPLNWTFLVLYLIAMILNFFVLTLLGRRRLFSSPVNVVITGITINEIASIIFTLLNGPFNVLFRFPEHTLTNCKLLLSISQATEVLKALLFLELILHLSLLSKQTAKSSALIVGATTLIVAVLMIPDAYFTTSFYYEFQETNFCINEWPHEGIFSHYTNFLLGVEALAFCFAVAVCLALSAKLKSSTQKISRKAHILLATVVIFWLPTFLLQLLIHNMLTMFFFEYPLTIACIWISSVISCGVKAVLFLIFHNDLQNWQDELKKILFCKKLTTPETYALYNSNLD